jgi:hypothetical protein
MFIVTETGLCVHVGEEITVVTTDGIKHHGILKEAKNLTLAIVSETEGFNRYAWWFIKDILPDQRHLERKEQEIALIVEMFLSGEHDAYQRASDRRKRAFKSIVPYFIRNFIKGYRVNISLAIANNSGTDYLNVSPERMFAEYSRIVPTHWKYELDVIAEAIIIDYRDGSAREALREVCGGVSVRDYISARPWTQDGRLQMNVTIHEAIPVLTEAGKQALGPMRFESNLLGQQTFNSEGETK